MPFPSFRPFFSMSDSDPIPLSHQWWSGIYLNESPPVVTVWFDGGSGPPAYGSFEIEGDGIHHRKHRQHFGNSTSNEAEYLSLITALRWLKYREAPNGVIEMWTDSQLVCYTVNGSWKCRNPRIRRLRDEVIFLLSTYYQWRIHWHRRHHNVKRFGH